MPAPPSAALDFDPFAAVGSIVCPGCGTSEPCEFVGDKSGAVVKADRSRFVDGAGFLYCPRCGLVLDRLWTLPEPDKPEGENAPRPPPSMRLARSHEEADPGFDPHEGENTARFMRLARTAMRYGAAKQGGTLTRAIDRIADAEALCVLLELPPQITAAVVHHVRLLSRLDLRDLSAERRVLIRSEAATAATVLLVLERFNIERAGALATIRGAFKFTKGAPSITDAEFNGAYLGLAAWFGKTLWLDGPEDRKEK